MNKTAIKNYAVVARRKLIEAVRQKAFQLYIFEDGAMAPDEAYKRLRADGIFLTPEQQKARLRLATELATLGNDMDNEKAYQHVIEEVAYTWFNRLIALRFMEVNDYLPSGIRILSSLDQGRIEPDAMREAERLDYVDQKRINDLRAETGYDASEKLYKYILISQCNALSFILPGMFEELNDYTELLLPDALYTQGGIVHDLVNSIDEEDFRDQVQIIGWLYQYYISERKDEVFAGLKKNIKINKETIPAATQLFTPEWIVKYMVENSLGRLWIERQTSLVPLTDEDEVPGDLIENLLSNWKYYIHEANQEPAVFEYLFSLRENIPIKRPEDIKLIDPCMGSGHILVYAFDLLYQIYSICGYAESDIPNLILQHNIYGLDIDGRAAQLAYFALMMKARSYNRRFFRQDNMPQPNVHTFIESDGAGQRHLEYMGHGMDEANRKQCIEDLLYLIDLFRDAREYGSILKIKNKLDYVKLHNFVKAVRPGQVDIYTGNLSQISIFMLEILDIAEIMTQKYDVVVTNPPYMGANGMDDQLSDYIKRCYPDSKSDMSTVFMEKTLNMCNRNGLMAMINIPAWMFLSSYKKLRDSIVTNNSIINMLHLGRGVFGADFGTTSFIISKEHINEYIATYKRLYTRQGSVDSQEKKLDMFFSGFGFFKFKQENYKLIPGVPIAYWVNEELISLYNNSIFLKDHYTFRRGITTAHNERFLRFWYEVDIEQSNIYNNGECKWFMYNKGGDYRKWYGNREYLILWENDGNELKNFKSSALRNLKCNYLRNISYSSVTISKLSFREYIGFINDQAGNYFTRNNDNSLDEYFILGLLNSIVGDYCINIKNVTLNTTADDINYIPIPAINSPYLKRTIDLVANNISIAQSDWDSFETSWDFKVHPLIVFRGNYEEAEPLLVADDLIEGSVVIDWSKGSPPVSQAYDAWGRFTDSQFRKLKANEEELNRIFIEIYGLQDELALEVEDKDVTIRRADLGRDIRSLVSYAVGCMFGRYSLDEPELIYAGGQFDMSRYKTFLPEDDNIIPVSSTDYFDDDIVVRFIDFVRTVYGEATLDENLNFIAEALYPNGNGTAKEKIRRYFLNDFYKDHKKTYKKRPIYWMLDSGKEDGFKALFYLHRYDKYTIARVRTDYLHPLQRKYEAEISRLEILAGSTESAREKAAYRKEIETLQGKIEECRVYDQVVGHIAHQQIELDLDDGVKVNYAKFQEVEVPKGNGTIEKMDLLGKI